MSAHAGKALSEELSAKNIELVSISENLVDSIWKDRPGNCLLLL